MVYQNDFYSITYCDNDKVYITELIKTINDNLKIIMDFFKIRKFSQKKIINIWSDLTAYKKHLIQYVEYKDWMVADTFDKNINILSFDLFLSGPHKNSSLSDYCKIIVHEFVHSCQQEINPNSTNVKWFWEALATNLANQKLSLVNISYTKEEIMLNYQQLKDAYSVSYTIGQYMIKHLSNPQILKYVKYPNSLINDTEKILERTKLMMQSY